MTGFAFTRKVKGKEVSVQVELLDLDTLLLTVGVGGKTWRVKATPFTHKGKKGYAIQRPPEKLVVVLMGEKPKRSLHRLGIATPPDHDPYQVFESLQKQKLEEMLKEGIEIVYEEQVSNYDWPTIKLNTWQPSYQSRRILELLRISPVKFFLFAKEKGYAQPVKRKFRGWSEVELTDYKVILNKDVLEEFRSYKAPHEREEEEKFRKALEEAKRTGKPVLLRKYAVPCDDPDEECDIDIIRVYVTPDGDVIEERTHTW